MLDGVISSSRSGGSFHSDHLAQCSLASFSAHHDHGIVTISPGFRILRRDDREQRLARSRHDDFDELTDSAFEVLWVLYRHAATEDRGILRDNPSAPTTGLEDALLCLNHCFLGCRLTVGRSAAS
jgi:hypothetical protein